MDEKLLVADMWGSGPGDKGKDLGSSLPMSAEYEPFLPKSSLCKRPVETEHDIMAPHKGPCIYSCCGGYIDAFSCSDAPRFLHEGVYIYIYTYI